MQPTESGRSPLAWLAVALVFPPVLAVACAHHHRLDVGVVVPQAARPEPSRSGRPRVTTCGHAGDVDVSQVCTEAGDGEVVVSVHVQDEAGAAVPGASLQVRDGDTTQGATLTDRAGDAVLPTSAQGPGVTIHVNRPGFCESIFWYVPLRAGCDTRIPVTLRLPPCAQWKCGRNQLCSICE
jgi:hypothetical protein